jgi:putative aldouronate transport system permease protein
MIKAGKRERPVHQALAPPRPAKPITANQKEGKLETLKNEAAIQGRHPVSLKKRLRRSSSLYLLLLPSVVILFIFTYLPMYGATIAFKDFTPALGILKSPWVGFKYFQQYFNSYQFSLTIKNTLVISLYSLLVTFPLPIVLALMCNQITGKRFKKFFQVSTYLPHFISTVVMCGMIILFLSPSVGIISKLVGVFGIQLPNLMGSPQAFPSIYVWTEAWQHVGWDSILYIAALSAVDPSLYEAATMDGASKWQKILNIDIPMLLPTATVMFILRAGSIMSVGFEKVYLLQNTLNSPASEIIATYVYKMGLKSSQYSLSSAIGLFNNLINLGLLLLVNYISKKLSDNSLV